MLSVARNPSPQNYNSDIFDALTQNTVFRRYFINRYADLINTIFLPSNVQQVAYMYRDTISTDMAYQFAWGSNNSDWLSNIQSMQTLPVSDLRMCADKFRVSSDSPVRSR